MSRKTTLLVDPDIARWYLTLSRGSPVTANVYFRRVDLFYRQNKLSPRAFVELGRKNRKRFEDLIEDHITKMGCKRKSLGYVEGILKAIKSWLVPNEIELKRKIKISNRGTTPPLDTERVPEKEELRTAS